jgi:NTP pyrophosphatase (non-canonical NTP hydrolase)
MKPSQYLQSKDQRVYDLVTQLNKTIEEIEEALFRVEFIALKHIDDLEARKEIKRLVDSVWRYERKIEMKKPSE